MDLKTFVGAVRSFADKDVNVDQERGTLLAEIHGETLLIEYHTDYGALYCTEDGETTLAGEWLVRRLGRFEQLARKILEHVYEDTRLIPVEGYVVDVLEENPEAKPEATRDVMTAIQDILGRQLRGMTEVVYLTSDAGEGKTSLIEGLARRQADLYLKKEAKWLLLPVKLGGRPIIALDDVTIGTLTNRLRFPYYFYESVMELVKLGALVLALDGFEEMFLETRTGEAVSSLGNLVTQLDSKGRLLVAARSAYYEYRDLEAQARLRQSLRNAEVSFGKVALRRWDETQFRALAKAVSVDKGVEVDGQRLYEQMTARLNKNHPLLTRAVLARRLIEEYAESGDRDELVRRLTDDKEGEQFFEMFISRLLEREANKWIFKAGPGGGQGASRPLFTVEEHHALLTAIAEEMWTGGVEALRVDVVEEVTEVVVEDALGKSPEHVHQARERISQHAFLTRQEGSQLLQFDHEHFRNFYVGRMLAHVLLGEGERLQQMSALRALIEMRNLPELAVRVCVARLLEVEGADRTRAMMGELCDLAERSRRTSFLRANVARLVLEMLGSVPRSEPVTVHSLYVVPGEARNRTLREATFRNCTFERFEYNPYAHASLSFDTSTVMHFTFPRGCDVDGVSFDEASLPSQVGVLSDTDVGVEEQGYYDPASIREVLQNAGFDTPGRDNGEDQQRVEVDARLKLVEKVARYYTRSTALDDNIFATKLGSRWPEFESTVLPDLLAKGFLREVPYHGAGHHRRFRLNQSFDAIEKAQHACRGNYERFFELLPSKG